VSGRIHLYYTEINPFECYAGGNMISATNNFITKIPDKHGSNIISLKRRKKISLFLKKKKKKRQEVKN